MILISTLTKINVPNFLFTWEDIKENRQQMSDKSLQGLAIINDMDKDVSQEYIKAFKRKNTDYIFWSGKNQPSQREKMVA